MGPRGFSGPMFHSGLPFPPQQPFQVFLQPPHIPACREGKQTDKEHPGGRGAEAWWAGVGGEAGSSEPMARELPRGCSGLQQQANLVLLDPCNALSGAELEEHPKSMVTP